MKWEVKFWWHSLVSRRVLRLISMLWGNHVIIDSLHWFDGFAHNNPKGMCRDVARQQLLFVLKEVVFFVWWFPLEGFREVICVDAMDIWLWLKVGSSLPGPHLTLNKCISSFMICGKYYKKRKTRPSLNMSHAFWPHNGEQGCTRGNIQSWMSVYRIISISTTKGRVDSTHMQRQDTCLRRWQWLVLKHSFMWWINSIDILYVELLKYLSDFCNLKNI